MSSLVKGSISGWSISPHTSYGVLQPRQWTRSACKRNNLHFMARAKRWCYLRSWCWRSQVPELQLVLERDVWNGTPGMGQEVATIVIFIWKLLLFSLSFWQLLCLKVKMFSRYPSGTYISNAKSSWKGKKQTQTDLQLMPFICELFVPICHEEFQSSSQFLQLLI